MARFVAVAVPVPHLDVLTYRVPDGIDVPRVGARVVVPVGPRLLTGCVTSADGTDLPEDSGIRDVADVLDDEPYLPEPCLTLALWMAEYYACAPGEAIAAALPPLSTVESRRGVALTPAGMNLLAFEGIDGLDGVARAALRAIAGRRRVTLGGLASDLATALNRSAPVPVHALVARLARQGLVTEASILTGAPSGHRRVRVAAVTPLGLAALQCEERPRALGPRQRLVLSALRDARDGLTADDLRQRQLPVDGLRRLEARGFVAISWQTRDRSPFSAPSAAHAALDDNGQRRELTAEQSRALSQLGAMAARGGFQVALVHGVTGSGKSEIYLRLAQQTVEAGRQVLVLVPEIGLTPALAGVFRATFGDRVAVQHSGLSDGERHDQWHRIRRGDVDVVVGTRSAVFAPVTRLGVVVVDEEHDSSYKQDEAPRYHGRDLAIVRAKHAGATAVLGSATPSLESYQHARAGRYVLIELEQRVAARPLADVRTVNMRQEYAQHGPDTVLSQALLAAVGARLERREQVLLLLKT
ncbi:MAG: primosomal protein N', partial [Deltaproteobacteria bacterium]|nr:primosomal protein N' [Deltaproteobacteria bacterium]